VGGGAAGGGGGLFAGVAAAASPADSDVFAAPAPAAARAGGGGDLFASPAAAPRGTDEVRWPAPGAGGAAQAAPHDGGRVENLTAQRHENSVLFSLSNLQSLAMPSASAKPSSATTAATSEGSGLIDIRAMAATTLGSPMDSRPGLGVGGSPADDLPAFGAFSPAAPVLLNLPTQSGPPKILYVLIGIVVLLIGGIAFFAIKLLSHPPAVVTQTIVAPTPAPAPAAVPTTAAQPGAVAAVAPGEAPKPSTIPDGELPPREGAAKPEAKAEGKPEKSEHHHGGGSGKGAHDKKGGDDKKGGGAAAVAAAPAPAAEPEKKAPKGSLDDLLEGALTPKQRSRSSRGGDDDGGSKKAAPEPVASGPLSKSAVVSGMNAVKPKVADCYNQFKVGGMAMVNVVIGKNGKVTSAAVTGKFAGTPTGACVEKAVKSASFPPSDGLSTPYPFQLR
jgi:hypothetical protein